MYHYILSFLIGSGIVLLLLILCSTYILWNDMKFYRIVYNTLKYKTFYKATQGGSIPDNKAFIYGTGGFSFNQESGCFILGKGGPWNGPHLHYAFYTFLNPYSCYWYIKYYRWFKKLNVSQLEELNPFIHKIF